MGYISDKLKEIFKKIRASKRLMYLVSVSVLVLFCVSLNVAFSFITNDFTSGGANIIVNDLKYRMVINEVELDESVGTKIPSNTIIGDRIIKLQAYKAEQFNLILNSLNEIDTKYEIIYKVCTNVNCTSFIDTPEDIEIAYHIDTPYVSGELKANRSKSIILVTDNKANNDYYVQIGLNVGYSYNELALTNQITNDYSPLELDGTLSIIGYVNGIQVEKFPTEPNYETGITCTYKDGTVADARGVFSYSTEKGWQVDIFGLNQSMTTCKVDFTEVLKVTYEVLSTRYDCANLATANKPSDPIISYSGNCSVIQDTENSDGTHTWRMKLLTSGTLAANGLIYVDAFLVGGGGGGDGAGGAGGYAKTQKTVRLDNKNGTYAITIGAGGGNGSSGGATSAFSIQANGGGTGGGSGGNAGGKSGTSTCGDYPTCSWYSCTNPGGGSSYGGGATCEFGEGTSSGCTRGTSFAYAGGGGGCGNVCLSGAGANGAGLRGDNSGSGGNCTGAGGSGVVVIRDART